MESLLLLLLVILFHNLSLFIDGKAMKCPFACHCIGLETICKGLLLESLDNIITEISTSTTKLDLSQNNLKHIFTKDLQKLSNLEVLVINHNKLRDLPANLSAVLPRLHELKMRGNLIQTLSKESLKSAFNLQYLDVSDGSIERLQDKMFINNARLIRLDLMDNKIRKVDEGAFEGLHQLRFLNLTHNRISQLKVGTFKVLPQLQKIGLSSNNLEMVPNNLFLKCPYIKHISISSNQIKVLGSAAFQNLRNVTHIDLQHNRIKKFPTSIFGNSFIHDSVNILHNPLDCECYLVALELKSLRIMGKLRGTCQTPVAFKGREIKSLSRKELDCTTCDFNECKNNGTCIIKEDYYICRCQKQYEGKFCQTLIKDENNFTWMIILAVCLFLLLVGLALAIWYHYKRRRLCNITKTQCCCCCFIVVVIVVLLIFFTLRIVSYMYEHA